MQIPFAIFTKECYLKVLFPRQINSYYRKKSFMGSNKDCKKIILSQIKQVPLN